jgi:Flp pilus assembly protein TadB
LDETCSAVAEFTPQARASAGRRLLVVVLGPLLWLVGLVVVAVALERWDAVEVGLIVTGCAFVLSLVVAVVGRRRRRQAEREADQR